MAELFDRYWFGENLVEAYAIGPFVVLLLTHASSGYGKGLAALGKANAFVHVLHSFYGFEAIHYWHFALDEN